MYPQASPAFRIHIGIYGEVNAGKSTLFNKLLGQAAAITSDTAGSTSDPMRKSCEILGLGPVTFIDTAGESASSAPLDKAKLLATLSTIAEIDGALWVGEGERASIIFSELTKRKVPIIKVTKETSCDEVVARLIATFGEKREALYTESLCKSGQCVALVMPQDSQAPKGRLIVAQALILRELLDRGCVCVSSTPATLPAALKALSDPPALIITDSQAVKKVYETLGSFYNNGRNYSESADGEKTDSDARGEGGNSSIGDASGNSGNGHSVDSDSDSSGKSGASDKSGGGGNGCASDYNTINIDNSNKSCAKSDSKKSSEGGFATNTPNACSSLPPLTTFSILMAYQKGDGKKFLEGAKALLALREGSRVLIAEFCTHTRSAEDIARVKIPLLIKKRVPNIKIDYTSGRDFLTKDLSCYNLVIHCGACMATSSYLRSAQEKASVAQVPMTNYGVAIAALSGVLEKIAFPS